MDQFYLCTNNLRLLLTIILVLIILFLLFIYNPCKTLRLSVFNKELLANLACTAFFSILSWLFSTGILMNFAGGGAYTYFKYIDSEHQQCPGSTYTKDHTLLDHSLRYNKSPANGYCVQQIADSTAGTVNMV